MFVFPLIVAQGPVLLGGEVLGDPQLFAPVDVRVGLRASYDDPFDPANVALDARIIGPDGRSVSVPGFIYRPYRTRIAKASRPIAYNSTEKLASGAAAAEETRDATEILESAGAEEWRVRFTPTVPGVHRITLLLRDRAGQTQRTLAPIRIAAGKKPGVGFVRIDPKNPQAFRLSTGQPLFPLGFNLGWAGEKGTGDYRRWIPRYTKAGADWGRVWLSPGWTTFALERPGDRKEGRGFGTIDLGNAWRLDQTLDLARAHGMRLNLAIDSYNVLRDRINWPEWERSPYNKANGGPLAKPTEFWTDSAAAWAYRNKLRYIVARWGADPSVFAWELWNEVDGTNDYDAAKIRGWHVAMARHLKSIDPYRHLVSTSFGGNGERAGDAAMFALPEMDFAMSHLYDAPDLAKVVADAQARLGALGKPHFVGEMGADTTGGRGEEDPEGLQIHDPLWTSLATGSAGGPMLWWWDSYVDPLGLEKRLTPARSFLRGIDWGAEGFRRVAPTIAWAKAPAAPERRDLSMIGGPTSWSAADPFNRPRNVRIRTSGAQMEGGPLSTLLQGTRNHGDLHNPVTFEVDLPRPTRFVLEALEISGWGGAGLTISLDGKRVVDRSFPDPDDDRITESLKQFVGEYPVEVPAGRHTIVVANPGNDWIRVGYRFVGAVERTSPPVVAWASVGKNTAIAWVRHEDWTWREVIENKRQPVSAAPTILSLPGLAGTWKAELWDTWKGEILSRQTVKGGKVAIPSLDRDVAVRLRR